MPTETITAIQSNQCHGNIQPEYDLPAFTAGSLIETPALTTDTDVYIVDRNSKKQSVLDHASGNLYPELAMQAGCPTVFGLHILAQVPFPKALHRSSTEPIGWPHKRCAVPVKVCANRHEFVLDGIHC